MLRACTLKVYFSAANNDYLEGQALRSSSQRAQTPNFSRRDGPSLSRILVGGTGRDIPRLSRPVPGFSNNPIDCIGVSNPGYIVYTIHSKWSHIKTILAWMLFPGNLSTLSPAQGLTIKSITGCKN